ncbi:MAG: 2-oxo acid dehydrogenase subunit E2 [Bacteroidales bacterium]|nr:2-oxo acid dehydrogenase subunit E2 [Bacteroidales bacterium]
MNKTVRKKNRKDLKHGWYLGDVDSLHVIMPYIYPLRTQNEAVLGEVVDITNIDSYLEKKNSENPDFKYTWFHVICAALAKVLILRPKMNYYIQNFRMYEHKEITLAFVVKRQFNDEGKEALATIEIDREGDAPIDQVHDKVRDFVTMVRSSDKAEEITGKMDIVRMLPRGLMRFFFWFIRKMQYLNIYPDALRRGDPGFSSIFISNLGSIQMNADYHHLAEWGDNSIFVVIGQKKKRLVLKDDGTYGTSNTIKLSLTIDERIADGFYFAKSMRLLRLLLQNPELLDKPASELIDFE